MPRELIRAPLHDRRRSLGWLATAWKEALCVHGPGDVQGKPVHLDDELVALNVDAYALDPRGRRLYDSVFFSRPKGRDKSGEAGRFAQFEAFGPCRFAGWARGGETYELLDFCYTYTAGEPMGAPVVYPYVRCMATEENQTGNVYDAVLFNLLEGPLSALPGLDAGLTRTFVPGGGEIVPSTASSASKDGGKETFVAFDETHLYVLPELVRMYATVRRNLAKRKLAQPWSLETSTMFAAGSGSVAEATYALAEAIREGKARAKRLLVDHREGPAEVDLSDEKAVRAALAEAYGPFAPVMDFDRILDEIWDPRNSPADSRRYFLNVRSSASDAWLTEPEWAGCRAAEEITVGRAEPVTLGFDGSRRRSRGVTDATALIGCRVADGHLFELAVWEQPDGPAGRDWQVPASEVDAAVEAAFNGLNVVGFYADPAKWETRVAGWEARFGTRLKVAASRAHPVEWWMTGGRASQIVRALEKFHNAVADRQLTHDGAFALTRHVLNARRRPSRAGLQIAKEHPDSPNKIDAAIAAVLAYTARLDALAAGVTRAPATYVPRRIR